MAATKFTMNRVPMVGIAEYDSLYCWRWMAPTARMARAPRPRPTSQAQGGTPWRPRAAGRTPGRGLVCVCITGDTWLRLGRDLGGDRSTREIHAGRIGGRRQWVECVRRGTGCRLRHG